MGNAVLAKKFQKQEDLFNMQYDHTTCSLFSYAFLFSDCNSTENVPKTIYAAKIVVYSMEL